jgi:hypothetical protein
MEGLTWCGMQFFTTLDKWRALIATLAIVAFGWPAGAAAQTFQTIYTFNGLPDGIGPFWTCAGSDDWQSLWHDQLRRK